MTQRPFGDDGTIDDLPWASVFDPAANARVLSAVQAEGFRAASRIVDRFVRAVGADGNGRPTATPSGTAATTGQSAVDPNGAAGTNDIVPTGMPELERLTRAWWSMAGQFLLRSMPVTTPADHDAVGLDVNDPNSRGAVTLTATGAGSASTEVWLHNRGSDDRPDVRLHCSDLLSHEGAVIRSDAVLMDTAVVPMPRRSSRGVVLTINLAPEVAPGVYRGTLLAGGHPDLWLAVVLTVPPSGP